MFSLSGGGGASSGLAVRLVREEKAAVRRAGLEARRRLSPTEREAAAEKIWKNFFTMPEVAAARTIMLYASVQGEVPTYKAMERVLSAGLTLVLPRTIKESRTLQCAVVRSLGELTAGAYGIPEPPPDAALVPATAIDVVAVPGVVFDYTGYRLGYGAGYYDGFLAGLRNGAAAVGIAFSVQMRSRVPRRPEDQRLLYIATEKGLIRQPRVMKPDRFYACYAVAEEIWESRHTGIRRYLEEIAPERERLLLVPGAGVGKEESGRRWRERLTTALQRLVARPEDCLVIAGARSIGLRCGEELGAETMAVRGASSGGAAGEDEGCPTFVWPQVEEGDGT